MRAVTKTVRGAPLRIPIAMGALRSLLFAHSYSPFFNEDDVMDLLVEKIRRNDVVFDIGAYHGVWAMVLARYAREVVAFEPNPGSLTVLKEMITVNATRNVVVCSSAIGSEPSSADLWGTGSGASLQPGRQRKALSQVKVETLDRFVESRPCSPDILKIDVEGAEYQVLTGAKRCLAHARVVCIELHFDELPRFGANPSMVETLMTAAGFIEVGRKRPTRLGAEDPSRLHVVYERKC
ncbi:MAG TPA: FkbM family methyltransferase [Vicinamibacterales bacterium]|nr:FkbM family methyltransferase [Vicinamibacterales bacterium]